MFSVASMLPDLLCYQIPNKISNNNLESYNWRKWLVLVSAHLIETYLQPLTSKDRERLLIVDDSTYDRNRSKAVELLSRGKDHTTGDYVKGFRMLKLGWSDGATYLPLAFSLLSSKKVQNSYQEMNPNIDKRTVGYRRRKEAGRMEPRIRSLYWMRSTL